MMQYSFHLTQLALCRALPILLISALAIPLHAWDQNILQLRRFVGQWKGEYTVADLRGNAVVSYPMEHSYYWMEGHLLGATAIKLSTGEIRYEYSEVWHDGAVLHSIVESDKKSLEYYGWTTARTLWLQSNYDSDATYQQLHTEKLEPTQQGFLLLMEGYQWSAFSENPNFMHTYSALRRLKKGESFELMETLPE